MSPAALPSIGPARHAPSRVAALAAALLLAAPMPATADLPEVKQSNWRWDEDWSVLRGAQPGGPWWLPFKYVPLAADGSAWASFGIEARLRYEGFENNLWGAGPAPDDGYLWRRVMPHADIRLGPFRAFGQLIAADAVSVGAGGARPTRPKSTGCNPSSTYACRSAPTAPRPFAAVASSWLWEANA
ncbi:MAG TPA: hypothetical protein VGN91_15665 [Bosea sp. (in: a-proteobacteria)]|jgi:hypothetical protein|nr:hypothetical protein [Bosea sp. (in: a-proteobacteria)]